MTPIFTMCSCRLNKVQGAGMCMYHDKLTVGIYVVKIFDTSSYLILSSLSSTSLHTQLVTCFLCMFCISSISILCCSMNGGSANRASDVPITQADRLTNQYEKPVVRPNQYQTPSGSISVSPMTLSERVSSMFSS